MKRYLRAYAAWLTFVLVCAGIAAAWYRRVEEIGWHELADRIRDTPGNTSNEGNGE